AGGRCSELAGAVKLRLIDATLRAEGRAMRGECHHRFFQAGIASALADSVDGDFYLAGARTNAGQRVGGGQTQVVVTVHAEHDVADALDVGDDAGNELAELVGQPVAHRIWNVDGGGAGFDGCIDDLVQELRLGAACVFGAELDVFAQALGV